MNNVILHLINSGIENPRYVYSVLCCNSGLDVQYTRHKDEALTVSPKRGEILYNLFKNSHIEIRCIPQ